MKKKNFMVKSFARNVQVKNHDLRRDYGLDPCADREMTTLEKKVSPQLYGMLIQQLLGFHADFILDVCYTWIATDQGILKPGVKSFLYNH